jgi:maltose O-acetyltransferase
MLWKLISKCLLKTRLAWWWTVYQGYRSQYLISPTFRFNGAGIQFYGDGRIEIGHGSYVGEGTSIQSGHELSVVIGSHCRVSHNVRIYTNTACADADFCAATVPGVSGSVLIGDGVWIGTNVYIGPGTSIGKNSVVGANSVVTRAIPPNEIWGGVPARLIRIKDAARAEGSSAT